MIIPANITETGRQLLIFKKKFFLKGFNLKKKRFFLHQQFQILELKKGFVLKKKEGFFHYQFPTLLQAS